jgi:hypothetical protein
MRRVGCVPFVVELGEDWSRGWGAEKEMSFCVVGFAFCAYGKTADLIRNVEQDKPSAYKAPAAW